MHLTGAEVTASAAGLAFIAAMLTLRERTAADRRDSWWTRAQWAIDLSLSADPDSRKIGCDALFVLADDPKATGQDLRVLRSALQRALDIGTG